MHAKGKTALEVATEIARAASAALPERIEDFAPALRDALGERGRRFNVIIDALDEASSPAQARTIIDKVILPVAETCADAGAAVVVGSRRTDAGGDLLRAFGGAARQVDLDSAEFFAEEDLAAYALATLRLTGDERAGNPYADFEIAEPVAARIARLSEGNFLVAGLTARTRGLYDDSPVDPAALSFSPKVDDAMREYLRRIRPVAPGVSAETLLTALAFAEAPGLPAALWRTALRALGSADVPEPVLTRFARSSAASFVVESSGEEGRGATFRVFHQALSDALLHARADVAEPAGDERALTRAFLAVGRDAGWNHAPAYLLRSLPVHAARAGMADDLLTDDTYLLHADLRRVMQVAGGAVSPAGRDRARLLGRTLDAVAAAPGGRAALFSVTEALDNLGTAYRADRWHAPYRAQWAVARHRSENVILKGHRDGVNAVCAVTVGGRVLLASGSMDSTVRLWDPDTGGEAGILEGHSRSVRTVCAVTAGGRVLLASGSMDCTVRLWDPATGEQAGILEGHQGWVRAVCALTVDGRVLLASAGDDRTVRLSDPGTGEQVRVLQGHRDAINAVCPVTVDGRVLLASASDDRTVRLWDPGTGEQVRILEDHAWSVSAVCPVTVGGRSMLASGSADESVRLWDPATGEQVRILEGHQGWVNAVCAVTAGGRVLLARGGADRTVRLWDPGTGEQARTREDPAPSVSAVCPVTVDGRVLLASGGPDRTVRLRDPGTGEQVRSLKGHREGIRTVCAVAAGGRVLLASGSMDCTVRLWDPGTGGQVAVLEGHRGWVSALCELTVADRVLLASVSAGRTVRLWDPGTGEQVRILSGHQGPVRAVCAVTAGGRVLLASGGGDRRVRLWDPATGELAGMLEGHDDTVTTMCTVCAGGRVLLASGSDDESVRLWDPVTAACVLTAPTQHAARAVAWVDDSLAVGLDAGLLSIKLNADVLAAGR